MERRFTAHKANCEGPFYVVDGDCMGCGAPESEAEGMMSHDASGHCFFTAQPENLEQNDAAIRALWTSCCGAVRYAGNDQSILNRIAELGEDLRCDERLDPAPPKTVRNRVTFAYESDNPSVESSLRSIVGFIADTRPKGANCRCTDFNFRKSEASFVFHWYIDCSIRFRVAQVLGGRWLVSIEDNDKGMIGTAMSLDKSLQASHKFTEIRWFTEDGQSDGATGGAAHPY